MFKLHDVNFDYAHGDGTQSVLRRISLELQSGKVYLITGRSGVGKSTLLYLLGLLTDTFPSGGSFLLEGRDVRQLSGEARAKYRRDCFGFLMQSAFLMPNLNCIDNVALPLVLKGQTWPAARQSAEGLIESVDAFVLKSLRERVATDSTSSAHWHPLGELKHRYDQQLSGGERKRFALLRAIVHQPNVLFADEPLSNLDPRNREAVAALLKAWSEFRLDGGENQDANGARTRTLVIVTHDREPLRDLPHTWIDFDDTGKLRLPNVE